MPKVSVCIPAYNRRELFRATLWSVLQQSFTDFEVVVSDNASQEDLASEVVAANDARVQYIRQATNLGGPANFRYVATVANGEYLLFLCSDDLLLPHALATAVAALDELPDCGGVVYMAAHYSDKGFQFLSNMPRKQFAGAAEYAEDKTVRDFSFTSPSLCLYRRSTFERLGGWHSELLAAGDWDLYSRVIRYGGGVRLLHKVLAIMRLHDDRDSNTSALHWGFYHDVMLLAAQSDNRWEGGDRARFVIEQLLWDFRLARAPWRTLLHAYRTGAFRTALFFVPREILRRFHRKLRKDKTTPDSQASVEPPNDFDRTKFDEVWYAGESIRLGKL